nr:MAG: chorismate mutase [Bacteroidota bacterium]
MMQPDQSASPAELLQLIEEYRHHIDTLDLQILHLLNERARYACRIGIIKKQLGLPIYSPEREAEIMAHMLKHNPGPLSGDAVRRLYERILDESRRLEREGGYED